MSNSMIQRRPALFDRLRCAISITLLFRRLVKLALLCLVPELVKMRAESPMAKNFP